MLARLLRRLHAPMVAATLSKEELCLSLAAVARMGGASTTTTTNTATTADVTTPLVAAMAGGGVVPALALRAQRLTPLCTSRELRMLADGAVALAWRRADVTDALVRAMYARCSVHTSSSAALPRLAELTAVAHAALDARSVYNCTLAHLLRSCAVQCVRGGGGGGSSSRDVVDTPAAIVHFLDTALRCLCASTATSTTTTTTATAQQHLAALTHAFLSPASPCNDAQRVAVRAWADGATATTATATDAQATTRDTTSSSSSDDDKDEHDAASVWDEQRARRVIFACVDALAAHDTPPSSYDALLTAMELFVHYDLHNDTVAHTRLGRAAVALLTTTAQRTRHRDDDDDDKHDDNEAAVTARLRRVAYHDALCFAAVRHALERADASRGGDDNANATATSTTTDGSGSSSRDALQTTSEVARLYDAVLRGRAVTDEQLFALTTSFAAGDAAAVAQTACVLAECRGSVPAAVQAALHATAPALATSVRGVAAALRAAWRDESGALLPSYAPALLRRIGAATTTTTTTASSSSDDGDAVQLRRGSVDDVRALLRALALPRPRRHSLAADHADAEAAARAACRAYVRAYVTATADDASDVVDVNVSDAIATSLSWPLATAVALACDAACVDADGELCAVTCARLRDAVSSARARHGTHGGAFVATAPARAYALLALRLCVAYDHVDDALLDFVAAVLRHNLRVACGLDDGDAAAARRFVHDVVVWQSRLDAPPLQPLCDQLLRYTTATTTTATRDGGGCAVSAELCIAAAHIAADARRYGDVVRLHERLSQHAAATATTLTPHLPRIVDMLWRTGAARLPPTRLLCDTIVVAAATPTGNDDDDDAAAWTAPRALRLLAAYARSRGGGGASTAAAANDGDGGVQADVAALRALQRVGAAALQTPTACDADVYTTLCAYAPRCRRNGDDADDDDSDEACEFDEAFVGALVAALPRMLDTLSPRQLADAVCGLGDVPRAGQHLTHQLVTSAVADYAVDNAAVLLRGGRDVARLLYGLARLHHTARGIYRVAAARLSRRAVLATLDRASAVRALAAFGAVRFVDRDLFARLARVCAAFAATMPAAELVLAVRAHARVALLNGDFYATMGAHAARRAHALPPSAQRELLCVYGAAGQRHDALATALLDGLARQPRGRLGGADAIVDVLVAACQMGVDVRRSDAAVVLASALVDDAARLHDAGVARLCGLLAGARWRHLPLLHALGDAAVRLKQHGELTAPTSRAVLDTLATHLLHHPVARSELSALARSVSKEALVLSGAEEEQLNMLLAR